jgi:hypothetical protein
VWEGWKAGFFGFPPFPYPVISMACLSGRTQFEYVGIPFEMQRYGILMEQSMYVQDPRNPDPVGTFERVVVIEQRHKSLNLKDLGGTEVSDRLFLVSWSICGSEFELLVNTRISRIRDVLPFPTHSKSSPEAIGGCHINGNQVPEAIVAVLDNSAGYNARDGLQAKTLLKAKSAWKIDETRERFESLSTEGLSCPLGTVVTLDGGP